MRRFVLVVILVLLGVAHWTETDSVTVPAWRMRFVDAAGAPLAGLAVEQFWRHYSIESGADAAGNRAAAVTDADGYLQFPERRLRASLLRRGLGPFESFMRGGLHASYGAQSAIYPGCELMPAGGDPPHYAGAELPTGAVLVFSGSAELAARRATEERCGALVRQVLAAAPAPGGDTQ